ncbi:Uncharacterized membrane protein [Rubritalea squalenifaciens DSM 18772]|uniref:Uncharacterized membrane protein n=1 Tax=Rubritalea squalenifaciens DSM 18772 TaxID=1123071 RepID=A0A1M6ENY4_9BACT|nr:hypothetical protein [Rubritalea squalenifaciens]SHI87194.1 Uncharacterized membrane protein [Rubritalea squalenifaciens DSM 18772]
MHPVLPLSTLIPLILVILAAGGFLAWRSSFHAAGKVRWILLSLRLIALIAICVLLLNPGKWVPENSDQQKVWPVLVDNSASMSVIEGNESRLDQALALSGKVAKLAEKSDLATPQFTFSDSAAPIKEGDSVSAIGDTTDLLTSGSGIFTRLQATGTSPEGMIIFTDGRQTSVPSNSNLALQARANNAPIYAVPIGHDVKVEDIELTSPRRSITAFPNQNVQITAALNNQNLGEQQVTLKLLNEKGDLLAEQELELTNNKLTLHTFSIKAPEKSANWKLSVNHLANEQRTNNNDASVHIRILTTKTRVFIAEGAPYWDSKFLAQLLRQQTHMDVHSVHRLSDTRYFSINSGEATPSESSTEVFPDSLEELSQYDLIVFGKNSEHFLTPKRIDTLKTFVRDQGGAVLFSRGKPYSGKLDDLEALEPVTWAAGNTASFSLLPTSDGQAAGLFGQALPEPDSPVWKSLPKLKDAHRIDAVKPFTRVLARGTLEGNRGTFPLLMVRRYGQGVTGLVNADGLWKWDFYPEARELGNMYSEYWTQLIQWMVAYSEFLPGHQYSLRASNQTVGIQQPIVFTLSYRGSKSDPAPSVSIQTPGGEVQNLTPASVTSESGKPTWRASFTPDQSGNYEVSVLTDDQSPSPALHVVATSPPNEKDNLNPDPVFLRELVESTGGKIIHPSELETFLTEAFSDQERIEVEANLIWQPAWAKWFPPLIILSLLASEWVIRRRQGLP